MAELFAAPTLHHWLLLTSALFAIGVYGMLTRRNAVGVLMALELCLNAAAVNFVLFTRYLAPAGQGGPAALDGAVMTIFVIAVAAAEVVVAMAIFVAMYAERRTVDVTRLHALKD